eukprot:TRINITY_DN667_c0_g2_i1.p4 TRINITY_DN667_c0_g2~~TRINITY_DN667_c0_g2_i1.p4  ORF type:complete len:706 (+),score=78.50 TRINITY_DN667_c0_g2_i1:1787-3904(+)
MIRTLHRSILFHYSTLLLKCQTPTSFLSERLALFFEYQQILDSRLAGINQNRTFIAQPRKPIKITLPDGKTMDGIAFETTPLEIAKKISSSLQKSAIVAKIDKDPIFWDLTRPLESDVSLQILTLSDPEAKSVFWHSSAHVLGEALESLYGAFLAHGPYTDSGFFYDSFMGEKAISQANFEEIERQAQRIIGEKQCFIRCKTSKENALKMFKYNPFKLHYIETKVADGNDVTLYKCGDFVDLCKGPHIPNTGVIGAFKLTKNSAVQSKVHENLQRVYGIAFPTKKEMRVYEKEMQEIEKRDHRNIGKQQELFFFNEMSPGSCFLLPNGAKIYNKLIEFMRTELRYRGYQEIITPNMFNINLWKMSGHYENFKDDMFTLPIENQEFGLKPMNCPGHCLAFNQRLRSYKELPLRWSEFAVLHRNEYSGALSGLNRVRRFVQDDAHIFVKPDQIEQEIRNCISLIEYVYEKVFSLKYEFILSTKPDKFIGTLAEWESAQEILEKVLNSKGAKWKINEGDGAFYGPKIDLIVKDVQKRGYQTGTIQLDFQLPQRFDLKYKAENGFERPVIIHRTILGSIERFMGVYIENCAGKFPFWISPQQVKVVPVAEAHIPYASKIEARLRLEGLEVEVDTSNATLAKKVRNAQLENYYYAIVVGDKEVQEKSVDVRERGGNRKGKMSISEFVDFLKELKEPPISDAEREIMNTSI